MFLQEYIASIDDIFQTINPNEKPRNKHYTFSMRYGGSFDMLCGVCGTCLNLLYMSSHCVQTCASSNKHISQTISRKELRTKNPIIQ